MANEYSVIDSPIPKEENEEGEYVSPLYENINSATVANNDLNNVITSDTKSEVLEDTSTEETNIWYQTIPRDLPAASTKNSDVADRAKTENHLDISCKRFICLLITIPLVILVCLIILAVLFSEVTKLKNRSASAPSQQIGNDSIELQLINQNLVNIQQLNDSIDFILQQLSIIHSQTQQLTNSNTMLQQELTTLHSQIQQPSNSNTVLQQELTTLHNQTQQLSDSNTMLQQQLTMLHNQTQQLNDSNTMIEQQLNVIYPVTSCAALPPYSPSGYYLISASNSSAVSVYCDMTLSCGGVTGGWMRVADLDMTNSSHQCPSGFMERNDSPNIRTCVRNEASGGCSSVELSTANIQYSTVCGRITAYQFGQVDNFESTDINSAYVDGVSLTHGTSRQHIWTFAAASRGDRICPCRNNSPRPDTVGEDFFCDAGNPEYSITYSIFYADNPLWDGDGCAPGNTCCSNDNPPYFVKTLSQPTSDNVEMRVCIDGDTMFENVAIEIVEIYTQ